MSPKAKPVEPAELLPPEALLEVPVRVWAELGRAQVPVSRAVSLDSGDILDLDRAPDQPVDVFVNGFLLGQGRLLVVDGDWAVRLESVTGVSGQ